MTSKAIHYDFFPDDLQKEVRQAFYNVDFDRNIGERVFFENAGGSFRLKSVVEIDQYYAQFPDCPERQHETSLELKSVQHKGLGDIRLLLNAKSGSILPAYTASMAIFDVTGTIIENVPGTNVVTSCLEHPSAYDACAFYAKKTGKELRIAGADQTTGRIEVDAITKLIDENTCALSIMYASNLSGAIMDLETIIMEARKIKPDLHIVVDAVQHAPHSLIDLEKTPVDAMNFAPYKFFGNRGVAFAYISDRVAKLPHHKLIAKLENEWELGSPTPSDYASVTAVIDYICWLGSKFNDSVDRRTLIEEGMTRIKHQEMALHERLLNGTPEIPGMRHMKGITVHFDTEDLSKRDLILAVSVDGCDCDSLTKLYRDKSIIVYERVSSSPYSARMLESLSLNGVVRISPLHCHGPEDVDKFLLVTNEILEGLII